MTNWFRKLFGRTKTSPIQTTQAKVDVKTQEEEALNIEIERLEREFAEIKANLKSGSEKPETKIDFQPPVSDEYLDSLRSQLTEKETLIKTLKKELEVKEDEVDDKEFDLNAIKKKLDESKKENSELKISLHDIENEYTAKSQELDKIKAEAKEIEEELGVKKQSLGFVGEILNAKEADSRDAIEIKEKTEVVIQFVKMDSVQKMCK
ncbi:Chromosome partition protein Smc [termite gut metagenome]|uniref:Chromosome partition protein Smc n=1 Tax=termite gut metagenome TaxID=433724 RepID=A0A5J4QNM3_9ZZZZ